VVVDISFSPLVPLIPTNLEGSPLAHTHTLKDVQCLYPQRPATREFVKVSFLLFAILVRELGAKSAAACRGDPSRPLLCAIDFTARTRRVHD